MPKKKKKLCFVLMPFNDDLKKVYYNAINPACKKANFQSLRVDELKGVFNINKKIIQYIFKSDAIIADLTSWNPNVFYEMGVAHAIDNKTVMIIQKDNDVPFDVSNYRCILYTHSKEGFKELTKEIFDSLSSIKTWRQEPSNPVQEYGLHGAFILKSEHEELKSKLKQTETSLKSSISKTKLTALQDELKDNQNEISSLNSELKNLKDELAKKKTEFPGTKTTIASPLRSQPIENFSDNEVKKMLKEKGFFDSYKNKGGKGLQHKYKRSEKNGGIIIRDQTTGLTWQQSGSQDEITFEEAPTHIQKLNKDKYAGFDDWRLPTLEEAMSLMEPEKDKRELYIDAIFDQNQRWIWTSDKHSASYAWVVNFYDGYCDDIPFDDGYYVRAVR